MVVVEVAQEVAAYIAAQRLFHKAQIVAVVLLAKGDAQEVLKALADVVGKPIAVEDGDDVVSVRESRQWSVFSSQRRGLSR